MSGRHAGPAHEGNSRTMSMHADEESDEGIVPMKRPNKEGLPSAEAVEGRTSPKGNGGQATAVRTPSRDTASNGLVAVRQAARQSKSVRFTALLHHITIDLLKRSYLALEARRGARDRRRDVADLRRKPRREAERPARADTQGQLSSPPGQTDIHPEGGRLEAASEHLVPGGQDRPTGGRDGAGGDLRGRLRRVFLWVPAGAWPARCAGRSPRRHPQETGELGARCGYPGLLRCHGPFVDHPLPRAPYRGQAHSAPHREVAEGRHRRRWTRDTGAAVALRKGR